MCSRGHGLTRPFRRTTRPQFIAAFNECEQRSRDEGVEGVRPVIGGAAVSVRAGAERAADLAERYSGAMSSALGIGGLALTFVPGLAPVGTAVIGASVAAGAVDTAVQGWNLAHGGRNDSTIGSTLYAATGMLPAASVHKLRNLAALPRVTRLTHPALLAANVGLAAGEVIVRVPRMLSGEAAPLDYLNVGAAFTGVGR